MERMIAAAELARIERHGVGHVALFLSRRRAARVAPRRGPARAEALDPGLMRAAMGAVTRLFADLRATGHVKASLPDMQTRKELYETLEYTPGEEWVMPAHFNK